MNKTVFAIVTAFAATSVLADDAWGVKPFPVIKEYDQDHLYRLALPLGGIGTGSVSLGGRGELRDWEIMNEPGKFTTPGGDRESPFFAITAKGEKAGRVSSLLEGRLYPWEILHWGGSPVVHHGFPRFDKVTFSGSFPAGTAHLRDEAFPFEVDVTGFNPFVPGDADGSDLPVATLTYRVKNTSDEPLEITIAGLMRNFIGRDAANANVNEFREADGYRGVFFAPGNVDTNRSDWGTMALVTEETEGISHRLASTTHSTTDNWWNAILDWWDDFTDDGAFESRETPDNQPIGTLAVKKTLAPQETREFTFHIVWNFPNRYGWSQSIEGNWYSRLYTDAWDAAAKILPQLPELERKSRQFTEMIATSDLPDPIKEAALFNLSVLKSQTTFRISSGHFMGWEGSADTWGTCEGNCTHVWNYEQAVAFLFPELARTMRDVEFNYATRDEDGFMSFRVGLPLKTRGTQGIPFPAADGQMGCIMKVYRDWQLSGDKAWLEAIWPRVKLVLSFAWLPGSWDENADGVMEGTQHNTMDVNYFGPNSQMQFWYMGALRAAEEMARAMGDGEFEAKCRDIYVKARAFTDEKLFNGEYYEQIIYGQYTRQPLAEGEAIPDFQLGKACLVDQLVGQQFANLVGLGWLCDEKNVKKTSESIMKYNWMDDFSHHFNNMRSFVVGAEQALLMASFPRGRLKVPFPYFSEVMTGFEYVAAVEMILEGRGAEGLKVIKAVRDRHDGGKRNPYSEPEWGHNYARSMASWGALNAWSGFRYSGVERKMYFRNRPGRYPWFVGDAWGMVTISEGKAEVEVVSGEIEINEAVLEPTRVDLMNAAKGKFLIGTALTAEQINHPSKKVIDAITGTFNAAEPENLCKPELVLDENHEYHFEDVDAYLDFCEQHGLAAYGHCLVWYMQSPAWLNCDEDGNPLSREQAIENLRHHIHTVVGHCKGRIRGWDVVNEAWMEDGTMRENNWYKSIGPDYIELAFRFANEADPDCELYYNDYAMAERRKANAILGMVKDLRAKGVRIDAVGFQCHVSFWYPDIADFRQSMDDFAAAGIRMNVTEMDISVLPDPVDGDLRNLYPESGLPSDVADQLACVYKDYFKVFLDHADMIDRVSFWGWNDHDCWLNYFPVKGRVNHPLLFDRAMKPKQALYDLTEFVR